MMARSPHHGKSIGVSGSSEAPGLFGDGISLLPCRFNTANGMDAFDTRSDLAFDGMPYPYKTCSRLRFCPGISLRSLIAERSSPSLSYWYHHRPFPRPP